ncbi:Phage-related baseplate assembly protein [Gemmata sp. SH-PL17]|uniref:type VI secretion system Vgr family protein n=1 Tax=Gemmata sp. SH-PL17 TaxID=1630693 RepID=UPI00078E1745|nr:type VI secretion system tip protein TssI/VgrG [Gemmata sp. SH-PL17]AMV23515.1 Phage-related baseplate assembly protein [Gemmata sp. SH-PL17]
MPLTQKRRLVTLTTPLGADAFVVTGFRGRERVSAPFEFTLDLVSENLTVAAADLVGKAVGWTINMPDDSPRPFHGFVRKLVAGETADRGLRRYRAEVVPWLWFLTRTTDCRIFQNMTVDAIITSTFDRLGLTDYKKKLQGTYPTREYCVQYRETAFAFVSRLMEEYGIYYFFEFKEGQHTLVLADSNSVTFDCAPHGTVEYRPDMPGAESVSSWDRRFAFRSGKITHTDYNFETPDTNLLKDVDTNLSLTGIGKFELFDYPGGYPVAGDGTALAKSRMEEVEAGYDTATGSSRCSSFTPGGKFTLEKHPSDNGSYVFLEVEHNASEDWAGGGPGMADYSNLFVVIPTARPFRPAPTTPRPRISGAQTAVVVGMSGEEIYTDKYGRVKVQFFWDRLGKKDENSSCWIRVSEMWAGKQWGMVFTPRIGQEVVVEFLEGDPDRPLITGRVYNAELMPPYALPSNMTQSGLKTRSSKGGGTEDFNELRFEDLKGKEDIYFHAQKDFHRFVENDDDLKVEHDQFIQIKNNRTLTVQKGYEKITIEEGDRDRTVSKGNDTLLVSKGNRSVTVSEGNESLTVSKGTRTVDVKSDYTVTVQEGNRGITVSKGNDTHTITKGNRVVGVDTGNDTLTVAKGNIGIKATAGSIEIQAGTSITLKVGANKIVIDSSGVLIDAAKVTLKASAGSVEVAPAGVTVKAPNVNLKGDAQVKVEGPMVAVEGAGVTTVKGGLVQIN